MPNRIGNMPLFNREGGEPPKSATDLDVKELSMRTAADLNRQWHSMLPRTDLGNLLCGNTSVAYGASYSDDWYGVAIYSQPIIRSMCDGETLELRRLAICDDAPKFTATRMLSQTRKLLRKKWPHLRRIISYQAVDVHAGTIYKADNWQPVGDIVDARPQRLRGSGQRATGPLQTHSRKRRWEHSL